MVDNTLYTLVVIALGLSLAINAISLFLYIDRKFPGLLTEEVKDGNYIKR